MVSKYHALATLAAGLASAAQNSSCGLNGCYSNLFAITHTNSGASVTNQNTTASVTIQKAPANRTSTVFTTITYTVKSCAVTVTEYPAVKVSTTVMLVCMHNGTTVESHSTPAVYSTMASSAPRTTHNSATVQPHSMTALNSTFAVSAPKTMVNSTPVKSHSVPSLYSNSAVWTPKTTLKSTPVGTDYATSSLGAGADHKESPIKTGLVQNSTPAMSVPKTMLNLTTFEPHSTPAMYSMSKVSAPETTPNSTPVGTDYATSSLGTGVDHVDRPIQTGLVQNSTPTVSVPKTTLNFTAFEPHSTPAMYSMSKVSAPETTPNSTPVGTDYATSSLGTGVDHVDRPIQTGPAMQDSTPTVSVPKIILNSTTVELKSTPTLYSPSKVSAPETTPNSTPVGTDYATSSLGTGVDHVDRPIQTGLVQNSTPTVSVPKIILNSTTVELKSTPTLYSPSKVSAPETTPNSTPVGTDYATSSLGTGVDHVDRPIQTGPAMQDSTPTVSVPKIMLNSTTVELHSAPGLYSTSKVSAPETTLKSTPVGSDYATSSLHTGVDHVDRPIQTAPPVQVTAAAVRVKGVLVSVAAGIAAVAILS